MTIEEKAKAYEERLDIARHIYADPSVKDEDRFYIEVIFPELKENEDERIRKELIEFVKSRGGFKQEYIVWLEKQGEHANFRNKIQIGDKVTRNRDGVLVNLSQLNRVAKKDEKQGEQKLAIEMKSAEESLGIDSETYNKIVDECIYGDDKQKPAWSCEDEERIKNILSVLDVQVCWDGATGKKGNPYQKEIDWLKSLRPQNHWKPSDDQIDALGKILEYFKRWNAYGKTIDECKSLYEQLKKLTEE